MTIPKTGLAVAFAGVLAAGVLAAPASADPTPASAPATAWGSGTLTEAELGLLVSQMSLEEKDTFLHGSTDTACATSPLGCWGQAGWIPGLARLGIPPLRLTDGPAGVRLGHVETAMPAPVGLTASFDRNAAQLFGKTVGVAGRASNQDVWLAPMMNAVNFVTGGRNFETLGEDPYLAGEFAAALTRGVQGEGMIAQIKHYIANDFENGRNSTSVKVDPQTLHENSLPAFEAGVRAGAGSVMCSYNRINDLYGCGNDHTLNQVLRGELGFDGFVTSDWGATHRTTDIINGLDMEQPGSGNLGAPLVAAAQNGTPEVPLTNDFPAAPAYAAGVWLAAMDRSVLRILRSMNKAGLLEGTAYGGRYTDGTPSVPPRADLASLRDADFVTARKLAEESATLLKNDGKALPLTSADLTTDGGVVVMGPTAIAPYTGGGGSAHVIPYDTAPSPYAELQAKAPSGAKLSYVPGYDLDGEVVPSGALSAPDPAEGYPNWTLTPADAAFAGQPGLLRQQITTAAVPSGSQPVLAADGAPDQLDTTVDAMLPAATGWRWSGTLTAPDKPGTWQLKVFVHNQASAQLFIDGLTTQQRRVNLGAYPAPPSNSLPSLSQTAKSHDPAHPHLQQATYTVSLAAGQKLHLDLRAVMGLNAGHVQLRWVPPDNQATVIAQAVAAARSARKAVIFAYDEGTEGSDRGGSNQAAGMTLPGYQEQLIAAVSAAQPNTVVVLNNGAPVLMPWAGAVKAVLQMWYPGQAGGPATANVLLGAVNPGGKLPMTVPADGAAFPTYDPACTNTASSGNCPLYPGVARMGFLGVAPHGYREITNLDMGSGNGIFQGYRWYDKRGVKPRFAFGHGLSYTTFGYSDLAVTSRDDGTLEVAFTVRNTGDVRGDEVPQVYLGPGPEVAGVQQAVKALRGFERVALDPGEAKRVTVTLDERSFQYWSAQPGRWVTHPGPRTVWVGAASDDLRLSQVMVTAPDAVSGVVPPTLSLALGVPATFAPFVPGVARDYTASTTVRVISTAGDAALSVSDPGHLTNGAFTLPSPLGVTLGKTHWTAPTTNEDVPVTFSQHIGATDALRTGRYSRTVTFTLSTTTP